MDRFHPLDVGHILSIPLSCVAREDNVYWVSDKKGVCSVKSTYKLALFLQDADEACFYSGSPLWT